MLSDFPKRPEIEDERRTVLLELLGVPEHAGIYVLGCFASHVTIYSQQVRALNLVDALVKHGVLSKHSSVAVIGGGISGLTAAAAAAVRGVRRIAVFEEDESLMRIQRSCSERFLHPHIYDWPKDEPLGDDAGLPLMNWQAGDANAVVDQLDSEWQKVREQARARLEPRTGCRELRLEPLTAGGASIRVGTEDPHLFDVVILAIGFGTDAREPTRGYWANVGLEARDQEHPGDRWLVSGFGDGALTDLMRLCILDFRHGTVLAEVRKALGNKTAELIGQELVEVDRKFKGRDKERAVEYRRRAQQLVAALRANPKLERRKIEFIRLNCTEEQLFSPKASVLNRLIAGYLLEDGRFDLLPGELTAAARDGDTFLVNLVLPDRSQRTESFHRLILRHGPHSISGPVHVGDKPKKILEEKFPEIWTQTEDLRKLWQNAPQHDDWTRTRLFDNADFDPGKDHRAQLRVSFSGAIGCVVIAGDTEFPAPSLEQRVKFALGHFARRYAGFKTQRGAVDTVPAKISGIDCFASAAEMERCVRALCQAELAIFDVTGWDPAVMLLLGIRAAVRRGVTVLIGQKMPETQRLPFNVASVNPIRVSGNSKENTWEALLSAFESGLLAFETQPNSYLDLPVFDAVRNLWDDFTPRRPEEQVLILRWFNPQYERPFREVVDNYAKDEFGKQTRILTVVDSRSPQLVEQRLYAEIRRTQLCICDWTAWRSNVFFELGVRLAVNPIDPVHIYCTEQPAGWKKAWPSAPGRSTKLLHDFFNPVDFTMSESEQLGNRLKQFKENVFASGRRGRLSPGRIYRIVSESVAWDNESGGRSIPAMLSLHAKALDGPAVSEDAVSPVLYDSFTNSARDSAIEALLAAWHYVLRRNDKTARADLTRDQIAGPDLKLLIGIGQELSARMRRSRNAAHVPLRAAILRQLGALEDEDD